MGPDLIQHPLWRADGSTVFAAGLYTVIAGVNGPVEVQRRDELPEEAAIEVNMRPVSGVGTPREKWLETVIQSALKTFVLVNMHPRTLVQITLQVTQEPSIKFRKNVADISIIPTLLNAAFAALVDSGLPLSTTITSALAVIRDDDEVLLDPKEQDIADCKSVHAVAYNAYGEQLLDESSGSFDMDTWGRVFEITKQACVDAMKSTGEDSFMTHGDDRSEPWLRTALEDRARAATAWRT